MTQPTPSDDSLDKLSTSKMISVDYIHSQTSAISPPPTTSEISHVTDDSLSGFNSSPYLVSKYEAMHYYAGISPTPPKLVWRTGSSKYPWVRPKGPEACRIFKEIRGVFGHKLNAVWKTVGPLVRDVVKSHMVRWSSIDIARFITIEEGEEKIRGPVVIWVGVYPDSLLGEVAYHAANDILDLLARYDIDDVEVEYRESIYQRSVGPDLLRSVSNVNTTVDVRGPLTTALGLPICASHRAYTQGTMGLYFAEGGDSDKVLGLTCHHVLFEAKRIDEKKNKDYLLKPEASEQLIYVQLLGNRRFDKLLDSIQDRIRRHKDMIILYNARIQGSKRRLESHDEEQVAEAMKSLRTNQELLDEAIQAIKDLEKFDEMVKKDWSDPSQRIIGHIHTSPALSVSVGEECFTEDWGAVELDGAKFRHTFKGNVIDLGTDKPADEFITMMSPRNGRSSFNYPEDRLLVVSGIIPEELMCKPDMLDHHDEPCLFVIKNGDATGVTIGRATGCLSLTNDQDEVEAVEWAIYNYNSKSGVFSDRGDSGSIIVDGLGRIAGLLTSGTGTTVTSDVTYATPMWWLWPRIKKHFPNAQLNPTSI